MSISRLPYSYAEIEAYVQSRTLIVGNFSSSDKYKILRDISGAIAQQPPWQQVLLIQSNNMNVVGDKDSVNNLYKNPHDAEFSNVNGFFTPSNLYIAFNAIHGVRARSPIVWRTDSRGEGYGRVTRGHEDGHRVDWLLARYKNLNETFYSDTDPEWKAAVKREIIRYVPADKAGDPKALAAAAEKMSLGNFNNAVYKGYRPLIEHLGYYKSEDHFACEAFAEMSTHYATLYTQTGADEQSIDRSLKKRYPQLWPVFRDKIIPMANEAANFYYSLRNEKIEKYTQAKRVLCELSYQPFDAGKTMQEARLAMAAGKINNDLHVLRRKADIYQDPIDVWVEVQRDYQDLYRQSGSSEEYITKKYLAACDEYFTKSMADNIDELVNHVLTNEFEKKAFEEFLRAHEKFQTNIGLFYNDNGAIPTCHPDGSIAEEFEAIKAERGLEGILLESKVLSATDGVKEYIQQLVKDHVHTSYVESNYHTEAPLADDFVYNARIKVRDILLSQKSDYLKSATETMLETNRLCEQFVGTFNRFLDNINEATGIQAVSFHGSEMAELLREYRKNEDIPFLKTEIERLKVSREDIRKYVRVREWQEDLKSQIAHEGSDISYGTRNGAYVPSAGYSPLTDKQYKEIGVEILNIIANNEATDAGLARAIQLVETHTHETIALTIGKPKPLPERLRAAFQLADHPEPKQHAQDPALMMAIVPSPVML